MFVVAECDGADWLKWGLSDEDVEQAIHILNDTAA